MRTWLTENLQIEHPLVLAPMAGVAAGELAAAVSAAGGLGMIGCGYTTTAEWITAQAALAAAPGKPFGIGLIGWVSDPEALLPAIIAAGPAMVSVSFGGELSDYIAALHDAGIPVSTQVGNMDEAREADGIGVDLLVVRGGEGGGHGRAEVATLPLLQAILEEIDAPVVAAGGIGSARGVAAVLAAGADGAWIGTAFAATVEATNTRAMREAMVAAEVGDTVYTRAFDIAQRLNWPAEYGGRALANALTRTWAGRERELEQAGPALVALSDQVIKARKDGDIELAPVYAGEGVGLITAVRSAAEVMADLAGYSDFLRRAAGLLD